MLVFINMDLLSNKCNNGRIEKASGSKGNDPDEENNRQGTAG